MEPRPLSALPNRPSPTPPLLSSEQAGPPCALLQAQRPILQLFWGGLGRKTALFVCFFFLYGVVKTASRHTTQRGVTRPVLGGAPQETFWAPPTPPLQPPVGILESLLNWLPPWASGFWEEGPGWA